MARMGVVGLQSLSVIPSISQSQTIQRFGA
jgi:hypothetical protein